VSFQFVLDRSNLFGAVAFVSKKMVIDQYLAGIHGLDAKRAAASLCDVDLQKEHWGDSPLIVDVNREAVKESLSRSGIRPVIRDGFIQEGFPLSACYGRQ
jgi:hypothetical protein